MHENEIECVEAKENKIWTNKERCLNLKTLDTVGNCQRPVFSHGVSQHMHKITNLWKFELNWSLKLLDNYERKNTLVTRNTCFQMLGFETSNSKSEVSKSNSWKITSFSKNYNFSQCFILSTALHCSITSFYTNNYFEELPTVSCAFKGASQKLGTIFGLKWTLRLISNQQSIRCDSISTVQHSLVKWDDSNSPGH